jgi:hypothetical protein
MFLLHFLPNAIHPKSRSKPNDFRENLHKPRRTYRQPANAGRTDSLLFFHFGRRWLEPALLGLKISTSTDQLLISVPCTTSILFKGGHFPKCRPT